MALGDDDRLLAESVAWGGATWLSQVEAGLRWLGDPGGLRILEIGARYGAMAVYFARRGAHVTGLDVDAKALERARDRAIQARVLDRTAFQAYSGNPADLPVGFDVVFSKSTLVLVQDLESMAQGIARSLVPGGRLLAVENARGSTAIHVARMIRWLSVRPYGAGYFTPASLATIGAHLEIDLERWTTVPPTVVVGAVKRP